MGSHFYGRVGAGGTLGSSTGFAASGFGASGMGGASGCLVEAAPRVPAGGVSTGSQSTTKDPFGEYSRATYKALPPLGTRAPRHPPAGGGGVGRS